KYQSDTAALTFQLLQPEAPVGSPYLTTVRVMRVASVGRLPGRADCLITTQLRSMNCWRSPSPSTEPRSSNPADSRVSYAACRSMHTTLGTVPSVVPAGPTPSDGFRTRSVILVLGRTFVPGAGACATTTQLRGSTTIRSRPVSST